MSQVLIQQSLSQLQNLRKVPVTCRESVAREAFKDLLMRATRVAVETQAFVEAIKAVER